MGDILQLFWLNIMPDTLNPIDIFEILKVKRTRIEYRKSCNSNIEHNELQKDEFEDILRV